MLRFETATIERILSSLDESEQLFSGYKLYKEKEQLHVLGNGAFSTVYEMVDTGISQERYALKVIGFEKQVITSKQFWDTTRLQRGLSDISDFVMRIIAAKELQIVLDENGMIEDVREPRGERWDEDGLRLQLILMEKLEEVLIRDRFQRVTLAKDALYEEGEVIRFAMQIGNALEAAHNSCVLHRDIKLENIFWDKHSKTYKLGDFGIAKYVEGGNAETVVYTDGYGAPEIERRLNDFYNITADIYSFGITLYLLLNDLKFPGSEGYHVNLIQYDSQFTFPAPTHASEGMTRVIRKMCSYRPEDRYQTMSEVLQALKWVRDSKIQAGEMKEPYIEELSTETYREENTGEEKMEDGVDATPPNRSQMKMEANMRARIYRRKSIYYFVWFTILFVAIIRRLQPNYSFISEWQFWVVPILVFFETILIRIKDFHIEFACAFFLFVGYSIYTVGISVPHIVLLFSVMTGMPVVTVAASVSTGIWMYVSYFGKMPQINLFEKLDLCWVLIVLCFIVFYRMILTRMQLGEITLKRKLLEMRAYIGTLLCVMFGGILLWGLQTFVGIQWPDVIKQLHLFRVGLISYLMVTFFLWWDGYLDEEYVDK